MRNDKVTDKPAISVRSPSGVTAEEARAARVRALRYALDCYFEKHESKKPAASPRGRGDNDRTRIEEDSADEALP